KDARASPAAASRPAAPHPRSPCLPPTGPPAPRCLPNDPADRRCRPTLLTRNPALQGVTTMPTHHRPARGTLPPAAALAFGAALLSGPAAQAQPQPGPALPTPLLMIASPPGGKAGSALEVTLTGTDLDEAQGLLFSHPGIKGEVVGPPAPPPVDPKKP